MWKVGETIGNREGRMDACVAAAGVLKSHTDCLEYPAQQFQDVSRTDVSQSPPQRGALSQGNDIAMQVMDVNVNGVLFTAQAAGRQMARFGNGGSIILVASMSGTITNKVCHVSPIYTDASACHSKTFTDCAPWQDHAWVSYNTSKSAVLQMARSMACELGPKRIRVNTLSPGHIYTKCVTLVCIFIHLAALTAEHRDHMYDIFVLFLTILPWRALNPPCASGPVINCDRPPNLNPKMDHSFNPISKNMRTG